jgi:hypothetical protein
VHPPLSAPPFRFDPFRLMPEEIHSRLLNGLCKPLSAVLSGTFKTLKFPNLCHLFSNLMARYPIGEVFAGLTVFEAVVGFFAKGLRETGDFSGAGDNFGGGFWFAKTMHPVFFGKCRFGFSWRFVVRSTSARGISCR